MEITTSRNGLAEPDAILFDTWTESEAREHITTPPHFDEVTAFVIERDHWQSGAGFTGPMESPDETTAGVLETGVQKNFTSENVLGEVTSRRTDGPLAREPERQSILLVDREPSEQDEALMEERDTVLDAWWKDRKLTDMLRTHGEGLTIYGRHYLRLRLPRGLLRDDGSLKKPPQTIEDALNLLYVEALSPDEAALYTDPDTMADVGIVSSEYRAADGTTQRVTETTYLDAEGRTELRQMYSSGEIYRADPPYDLEGRLLLYESCEPRAFVSPQMLEGQRALNTASTCLRVVGNDASFPIRILLNAMPVGRIVVNEETRQKTLVPEPLSLPPGAILNLIGVEVEDAQGNLSDVKAPGVASFDAAPIENFIREMDKRRFAILKEAKQAFVEMSGDATASGESRIQAMAEYERDGEKLMAVINAAGQWICDTAWTWAQSLLSTPGPVFGDSEFVTDFRCRYTRPSPTSAVLDARRQDVKEGLLSDTTYIGEYIGVDPEAEQDLLDQSQRALLARKKLLSEVITSLSGAGAGLGQAARWAGVEEEEATMLARMDFTNGIEQ